MIQAIGDGGSGQEDFDTRDSHLAAALMAVGVRPIGREPVRVMTFADRPGESFQFYFQGKTECGKYNTRTLLAAWIEGLPWIEKNPDHPFAHAMACALNYKNLMLYVKRAERQVFLQRGKSVAVLPANASAGLEEQILGRFQ